MGIDQIDTEKKITEEEDKITTTNASTTTTTLIAAIVIAITQKVFQTTTLYGCAHVCLLESILYYVYVYVYVFIHKKCTIIRKVFEFSLFDRTLFLCCPAIKGAANETQ